MLTDTLISLKTYCISLYLSLADSTDYATNSIGMYLSKGITTTSNAFISAIPQLINTTISLTSKTIWTKVEWQYIAQGGGIYYNR